MALLLHNGPLLPRQGIAPEREINGLRAQMHQRPRFAVTLPHLASRLHCS